MSFGEQSNSAPGRVLSLPCPHTLVERSVNHSRPGTLRDSSVIQGDGPKLLLNLTFIFMRVE